MPKKRKENQMANRRNDAGNRGDFNGSDSQLYRLGELENYKIASDEPDVRGWTIVDRDNKEFGTIEELVVDPDKKKVRYLDVNTSRYRPSEEEHRLLIPIGLAQIDDSHDQVRIRDVEKDILDSVPAHSGGVVSRAYEEEVAERFNNQERTPTAPRNADFYSSDLYDESRFYAPRNRNRGV